MIAVHTITPFILVPDLDDGIAFYEGLGFSCTFRDDDPGYAFLRAEGGGLRLLETDRPEAAAAAREHMVYIDVPCVDTLWDRIRPFLSTLPEGRVRAPFDQSYGQRELHAIDPGGTLVLFGQAIA